MKALLVFVLILGQAAFAGPSSTRKTFSSRIENTQPTQLDVICRTGVAPNESGQDCVVSAGNAQDGGTGIGGRVIIQAGLNGDESGGSQFLWNPVNPEINGNGELQITGGSTRFTTPTSFNQPINAQGGVVVSSIGSGYQVAEGSNAKQGTTTLIAGTQTVMTTSVTANSRIFLTCQNPNGGTPGAEYISARTPGTSFVIASSAGDTCITAYEIFEPSP